MSKVKEIEIEEKDAGLRLDRWFKQTYPDVPFSRLQKLLRTGQVRLDGKRVKASARIEEGHIIRIPPLDKSYAPKEQVKVLDPELIAYAKSLVVYEDKDILVMNKPAGMASQSGQKIKQSMDDLLEAFPHPQHGKPRLVHRLDRDTSGLLVTARTRQAAAKLSETFRTRSVRKIYWALTAYVPKPRQGRISAFIAKRGSQGEELMQVVGQGETGAQHSLTHYSVIDQVAQKMAWVSLKPVTGRTHQLRVHLAELGTPIIGDPKYFAIENYERPLGIEWKLHLHARRLTFPHPSTNRQMDLTAPLSEHIHHSFSFLGLDPERFDAQKELEDLEE